MTRAALATVTLAALLAGRAAAVIPPAPAGVTDVYTLAEYAAQLHGLPPSLMRALVQAESAGNPNALSKKGAMGLTQLMPATARELGVANPWNPWQNVYGGAKYLRQQLNTFGRVDLALAAYNAGAGNVRAYRGVPPFKETQQYVLKVTGLHALYGRTTPQGSPVPTPAPVAVTIPAGQPFTPPVTPPFRPPALPTARVSAAAPVTQAPAPASIPAPVTPAAPTPPAQFTLHSAGLSATPATPFSLLSQPALGPAGQP